MSNTILTVCGHLLKQKRFGDRRLVEIFSNISYIANLTSFGQITKGNIQLSNHFYAVLAIFFPRNVGGWTTKFTAPLRPLCVPASPPIKADITRHIRKHRERKEGRKQWTPSQKDYYKATTELQYRKVHRTCTERLTRAVHYSFTKTFSGSQEHIESPSSNGRYKFSEHTVTTHKLSTRGSSD